jgi:hypothetical protein
VAVIEEEKIFFFPRFARPGEEEDPQCRSKRHRFGLFFFFLMKRRRFPQNAAFHLNGKWRQKTRQIQKLVLQFARVLHFGTWSRISSIKSLIGHQTSIFMQLSP